ncbi:MAG: serine--tRNA ligase [Spirochaetaceae bacterium]|nr:MAG: serine--tRNA ligase [Spirochaetaceae bacterium]
MIDIKHLKDNMAIHLKNIAARGMTANPELALELYEKRNAVQIELDELRRQRNATAEAMKGKLEPSERSELIERGKALKELIPSKEEEFNKLDAAMTAELEKIPNLAHPDAPVGKEEKDNLQIRSWGKIPEFSFEQKDHVMLGDKLDLIDFDTATRVSGPKFYFLKNQAVFLEMALVRFAMELLQKHGFTPTITPDIAREEVVAGIGFQPRGEESNIYTIEGTGTCLVGTAEITLGGYHAGKILEMDQLPIRLAGVSHCFRREAGAAGQYSKGLYRVHQFTKVEMFVYTTPEESENEHQKLCAIEEEIFQTLGIPYRVVDTCTGDLGAPAYRKYDLEAWMPGRGENGDWGEVTSTSNCTDYQARRLNVRYRDQEGKTRIVHMLNGTAIAISRALVAIMENFQQADGSITIPEALVPYTGFNSIKSNTPE